MSITGISAASAAAYLRQPRKPSDEATTPPQTLDVSTADATAQQPEANRRHHRHGTAGAADLLQPNPAVGKTLLNTIA